MSSRTVTDPPPRVRELTQQRVTLADLTRGGDLPADLVIQAAPVRSQRSTVQQTIDRRVAEVYQEWVATGRETKWLRCPIAYYPVAPEKVADLKLKIRYAGKLGVRVHDGKHTVVREVKIRFGKTDLYNDKGEIIVAFTVNDKTSKEELHQTWPERLPSGAILPSPRQPLCCAQDVTVLSAFLLASSLSAL